MSLVKEYSCKKLFTFIKARKPGWELVRLPEAKAKDRHSNNIRS